VAGSDNPRKRQVLVVEDEAAIRELFRLHLSLAGFDVTEVADGLRALDLGRSTRFDLMVLDVMLPGIDGITLCRAYRRRARMRRRPFRLTALDTESDKVLGLESGADDYLAKPFGIRELMARVGARLRRTTNASAPEPAHGSSRQVRSRDLVIDAEKRAASVRGEPVDLTKQDTDHEKQPRTRGPRNTNTKNRKTRRSRKTRGQVREEGP
jgi:DNA-binding response OmpR family regulator